MKLNSPMAQAVNVCGRYIRAGLHYGGEASGRSRMLGQDNLWLFEANGGCAGEELKAIKYFY
jgi:hypothetical protein